MHLPTLTDLTLRFIDGFVVTDLVHSINLRHLTLKSTTFFEDSAVAELMKTLVKRAIDPFGLFNPEKVGIFLLHSLIFNG